MLFRSSKPRYTVDEVHLYVSDMDNVQKMQKAASSGREHKEFSIILHVMREVLIYMISTLDTEDRPNVQERISPKEEKT